MVFYIIIVCINLLLLLLVFCRTINKSSYYINSSYVLGPSGISIGKNQFVTVGKIIQNKVSWLHKTFKVPIGTYVGLYLSSSDAPKKILRREVIITDNLNPYNILSLLRNKNLLNRDNSIFMLRFLDKKNYEDELSKIRDTKEKLALFDRCVDLNKGLGNSSASIIAKCSSKKF